MIHSPRRMKHKSHVTFWRHQATIIARFRSKRFLLALIIQVHDASPKKLKDKFIKALTDDGWLLMSVNAQYPKFGDSIDFSAVMVLGIHSSMGEKSSHLYLKNLPSIVIRSITDYIVEDFNKENYIFSWAKDSPFLDEHDIILRIIPSDRQYEEFSHCDYYLAKKIDNSNIKCGSVSITRAASLHRYMRKILMCLRAHLA